jgi:uncharacterized Fe-S cluster protein YjdI
MADTPDSVHVYSGEGVTVTYDVKRCIHFAECVHGLPEVFDVEQHPWVQPDRAPAERVAEIVRRCPSGALHYVLSDGPPEEPQRPTRVTFVPDGPMTLRGDLVIDTPGGELHEVRASLCRCGLSRNRPFCDHECTRVGWVADDLTS